MQAILPGASRACAALVVMSLTLSSVSRATAADVVNYNFNVADGGWFSPDGSWAWSQRSSSEGSWKLPAAGKAPAVGILYSPCYEISAQDVTVTFDLRNGHRFNFGFPLQKDTVAAAGQVQFSVDGGLTWSADVTWRTTGSDVPATLDPTLLADPGALATDGLAFEGISAGYAQGKFIKSAFDIGGLVAGGGLRFRFLAEQRVPAALGPGPVWDVEEIQIKGVAETHCFPEPDAGLLAAAGLAALGLAAARRGGPRRRRKVSAARRPRP